MPPKKSTEAKPIKTKEKVIGDKPKTTARKLVSNETNSSLKSTRKKKETTTGEIVATPVTDSIIPIILESPNKIKKIITFLPKGKYIVLASCGHFRAFSNSYNGMGFTVDESGVKVEFIEEIKKKQIIINLRSSCKTSPIIYLATDPDREGEAIAWHIMELLGAKKDYYRIRFNSITRNDVLKALDNPTRVDMNLVLAQRTRMIMDKWIGFKVSPLCWANISKQAKSAGRVQSPALKLLVDREREITDFKPVEYFTVQATFNLFTSVKKFNPLKDVPLHNYLDMKKPLHFMGEETAMAAIDNIQAAGNDWKVSITEDESASYPPPPYTTLTMLQDCHTYLKMNPEHAMMGLQKMYESGWITYHRTDSVVMSPEGLFSTREAVEALHPELLCEKPRNYTNKSLNSQEAHEPIRPTHYEIVNLDRTLEDADKAKLDPRIIKMYSMIYLRTIATQCKPLLNTTIHFTFSINKEIDFSQTFSFLKNLGWKTLYTDKDINLFHKKKANDPEPIPKWILELQKLKDVSTSLEEFGLETHHTNPPPFFNSSTLIKELESFCIGRPSTYSSIISKLTDNSYMFEKDSKLHPTPVGIELVDFLETIYKNHFMNLEYTKQMEKALDDIAEGTVKWDQTVSSFIKCFPIK
jgi:DNA topoisomerase-1